MGSQILLEKITEWDEYTGRFEASNRVEVRARVSGFLESVNFEDGQMVNKDADSSSDQGPSNTSDTLSIETGPPVETKKANTDYKPAFEGQTRIGSVKTTTGYLSCNTNL